MESVKAADRETQQPERTVGTLLDRALEFDFTRPLAFAALAVVYVASRLPWLNLGYGTDPDAWRVALTAEHLLSKGEYLPSRLPGFPLHELVTVPLVRGGWVWTNLSTVMVSLAGVYLFARILAELNLPNKGVLTLAFAFTPLLWINSVTTMDYMWALTFILGCYLALIRGRSLLGGVCLGLAVGFRITSAWAAFAFLIWLWRERRLRSAIPFLGAMGLTSLVAYSPVLATYGLRMFNFYDAKVGILPLLKLLGKETLGLLGTLSVIAALIDLSAEARQAAARPGPGVAPGAVGGDGPPLLRLLHPPAPRGGVPHPRLPLRVLLHGALLPADGAGGSGGDDTVRRLRRRYHSRRRARPK